MKSRLEHILELIESHIRGEDVDFNFIRAQLRILIGEKRDPLKDADYAIKAYVSSLGTGRDA